MRVVADDPKIVGKNANFQIGLVKRGPRKSSQQNHSFPSRVESPIDQLDGP